MRKSRWEDCKVTCTQSNFNYFLFFIIKHCLFTDNPNQPIIYIHLRWKISEKRKKSFSTHAEFSMQSTEIFSACKTNMARTIKWHTWLERNVASRRAKIMQERRGVKHYSQCCLFQSLSFFFYTTVILSLAETTALDMQRLFSHRIGRKASRAQWVFRKFYHGENPGVIFFLTGEAFSCSKLWWNIVR